MAKEETIFLLKISVERYGYAPLRKKKSTVTWSPASDYIKKAI
jgi:hypothetical protein